MTTRALRRLVRHAAQLLAAAKVDAPLNYTLAPRYAQTLVAIAVGRQALELVDAVLGMSTAAPEVEAVESAGAWVVLYPDRSAAWVARSEVEALRLAQEHSAQVAFIRWGDEVKWPGWTGDR